jgi:hypothetical protein
MTRSIYRVQVTGLNAAGVATTYHFATESFTTTPTHPTIPNTYLDGRLDQPLVFKRSMYGDGQTRGAVPIAHGTVILHNTDGGLDALGAVGFDAQDIFLYQVDLATPDVDVLIWRGNTESVTLDETSMTFTVREPTYLFDLALQPLKYAGDNVLPDGLEGTADNIKGQPKPIWLGTISNVSPPLVNASQLIYQLSDRQIDPGYTLVVKDAQVPLPASLELTLADISSPPYRRNFMTNYVNNGLTHVYVLDGTTVPGDIYSADGASCPAHGLTTGDAVYFRDNYPSPPYSGGLPWSTGGVPLAQDRLYYIYAGAAKWFTLHTTHADSLTGANALVWMTGTNAPYAEVLKDITVPGCYDWCNDATGVYIRLGSTPFGALTVTGVDPATATLSSALQNILDRVTARGFGSFTLVNTVGHAPYPAIADQAVGAFVAEEMKVYELIQSLCASLNASFAVYPTASAAFPLVLARPEPGTVETPLLTIAEGEVRPGSFRRSNPADPERGTPAWRLNLRYGRNYTVQQGSEVPGASPVDAAFAALEYRTSVSDNVAIQAQFPAAPEINVDTLLVDEASAALLASYFVGGADALYRSIRDIVVVQIPLARLATDVSVALASDAPTLNLTGLSGLVMGKPVALTLARFTRTMYLIGYEVNLLEDTVQLTLWG